MSKNSSTVLVITVLLCITGINCPYAVQNSTFLPFSEQKYHHPKETVSRSIHPLDELFNNTTGLSLTDTIINQELVITNCTSVLIRNVTISHGNIAVRISDSFNITLVNCDITDGLFIDGTEDINIINCTVSDSAFYFASIFITNSSDIAINDSTIHSGFITVENSLNTIISGNIFVTSGDSDYNAIIIDSCSNTVLVDNILVPGNKGIAIKKSDDTAIINNTIDARVAFYCIWLLQSRNTNASGNILSNATRGFNVEGCNTTIIKGNTVKSSLTGIYTEFVNECVISGNELNTSSQGLQALKVDNYTITGNYINSALTGIYLTNNSNLQSSMIHITGNYFCNVSEVIKLRYFDDFTGEGLFMHDNYCNGVLFNGTEAQCAATTATVTASSAFLTFSLPALAALSLARRKKDKKRP